MEYIGKPRAEINAWEYGDSDEKNSKFWVRTVAVVRVRDTKEKRELGFLGQKHC